MSATSGRRIVVIGSGIGGLATAALLARDGFDVTVLEKNEQPGGRASLLERDGFRFDMGPSWYLMPDIFERFFNEMGAITSDYLRLTHLSPHYRIFYADGTWLDITGDLDQDRALFEKLEPGSSAKFDRYLAESKLKYEVSVNKILYRNMTLRDFIDPDLRDVGKELNVFQNMQRYVASFFKTEKMQQIIQYTLVFLGGIPKNTPALYSLMSHVDFNLGVFYPDGGIRSIVDALVSLGEKHGVKYVYNQPVTRIMVEGKRVHSVECSDKHYETDWVVSNADYHHTETLLSDQSKRQYSERYWKRRTLAPSAFIMYLGLKEQLSELVHHNLLFSPDWNGHFRDLSDKPQWPAAPSLYICAPSKTDSSVAPAGHENLFVLVPVASGLKETPDSREQYADQMIDYIERSMHISIRDKVIFRELFSITDFAQRYNSYGGSALGLAHTMMQSSLLRPPNKSPKLANLFYVGANTNPGIGVPMCLISAHNTRDRLCTEIEKS